MPATSISVQSLPGFYSQTGTALTMTAADVANGNKFTFTTETLLVAQNTHGSTSYTVTITSVADGVTGRTGDVSAQSLAAGEIRIFRLNSDGWADSSQEVSFSANNASVKFGLMNR